MVATFEHPGVERPGRGAAGIDEGRLNASVDALLNRRPSVGMAIGVVRRGRLAFFRGHGLADVEMQTPITEDTVFRIASISKTFTAIAVMQLWERGAIHLDAPASDYLRAYRLVPAKAGHRPATVRHLLTHTAGVPEVVRALGVLDPNFGESVALERPIPSLAEYYHGELRLTAEPGRRFVYTDHGFATLGQIVEDVSGQPLDRYLHDHVFEPLGMAATDLLRSSQVEDRLATGYTLGRRGVRPVTDRHWVTAAASSIYSSPRDMARYIAALLGGGANDHGSVLAPATLAMMFEAQYRPDPRVPGIGLAFSRFDLGGHRAVEHEGVLPGFNSQIFVAPDDGVGVMAFTNGAPGAMLWLPAEIGRLLGQLLEAPDAAIRTDIPSHPETWADICGWYPLDVGLTDARARLMLGAGAEVFVRGGEPVVRVVSPIPALYRGFTLHPDDPDDPDVYRIDLAAHGIGPVRVVFSRDQAGTVTGASLEVMPLSLRKRPNRTNPRVWATIILDIVAGLVVGRTAVGLARRRSTATDRPAA